MVTVLKQSPWGQIDQVETYEFGIHRVSVAGHGGLMIDRDVAHAKLTREAIGKGELWHGFYCYEEDCLWAIPALELESLWDVMFASCSEEFKANPRNFIMKTVSEWDADYLLKRGIVPLKEEFTGWHSYKVERSPHKIAPIAHLIRTLMNQGAYECFSSEIQGKPHTEGTYTGAWFREDDRLDGRILYVVETRGLPFETEDRPKR